MALAAMDADERLDAQVADDNGIHELPDYRIELVDTLVISFLVIVLAYCVGSISFAVVVSRLMRLPDPRSYGSKNPGATNVLRSGRKAAAVLTLVGDAGKGWVAVWLAAFFTPLVALAGLAAFLGHLFPLFHRFQGGKGVATAAGVLFGLDWRIGLGTVATWLVIALCFRYSSLAALIAAAFAPVATALLLGWHSALIVAAMSALLAWRHKQNIARLFAGTEPRLGEKKPSPPDPSAA
jgi:acyl phosphate:glycerol-3-phosphate acyltransferase